MNKKIKKLWEEKQEIDKHSENLVLQSKEWDSIAKCILNISEEITTMLTAEDMEAVNWSKKRLGLY